MRTAPDGFEPSYPDTFPLEGFIPDSGMPQGRFEVASDLLRHLETNGPYDKYNDAFIVEDCLTDPDVIFGGLERENYEDGLCYCCKPGYRYNQTDDGEFSEVPADKVFCVYLKPIGGGFRVLDWEWRKESDVSPAFPSQSDTDFTRVIWRR